MVKKAKIDLKKYKGVKRTQLENVIDEETGISEIGTKGFEEFMRCPLSSCSSAGKYFKCYRNSFKTCRKYKKKEIKKIVEELQD